MGCAELSTRPAQYEPVAADRKMATVDTPHRTESYGDERVRCSGYSPKFLSLMY
jgi:hypothetical protein